MTEKWINYVSGVPILADFLSTRGSGPPLVVSTSTGTLYYLAPGDVITPLNSGEVSGLQYLTSGGSPGIFVYDTSNLSSEVAADPLEGIYIAPSIDPTGASGAWVRQFEGPANVRWFGAVGDGVANDSAAFVAAIALCKYLAVNTFIFGGGSLPLYVPPGHYYLSNTTLDITHTFLIYGDGTAHGTLAAKLEWAVNTTGIRIQYYNTSGAGDVGPTHSSGASTALRGLWLSGGYTSFAATPEGEYHGIHAKAAVTVDDCRIEKFQGDGFFSRAVAGGGAPNEGNANVLSIRRMRVDQCRNGIYLDSADVNAGYFEGCNFNGNRQWAVWDTSFLGNSHVAHHAAGNGQSEAGITPTMVSYLGNCYYPKVDEVANAQVNAPSGTTADTAYWYYYAPGGPAPSRSIPTWTNGMALRSGGAYCGDDTSAANLFAGCYSEQDQSGSQIVSPGLTLGGLMAAGVKGNGAYLRSGTGFATLDNLRLTYDFDFRGVSNNIGPQSGTAYDSLVKLNNTSSTSEIQFIQWTGIVPTIDATIRSFHGTGALIINGRAFISLSINNAFIGNITPNGIDLAAGKDYRVNNVPIGGGGGSTPTGTGFTYVTAGVQDAAAKPLATVKTDLGLTGTNSGDQTSIVGITGTLAQFNTALTGADFTTGGGTATGTNTGDQTIALTGDVTGSGTASFAATIGNNAVSFTKFVAAPSAGVVWASGAANYAHNASGGGTSNFLRADGTWAVPPGSGGGGVPTTRLVSTTAPLTGGGDLSADRTLAISAATSGAAGSMSATDKTKLDNFLAPVRMAADAAPRGTAIADYFAATLSLEANSTYAIECHAHFLKTTAGTVIFTWACSSAPVMITSRSENTPIVGYSGATVTGAPIAATATSKAVAATAHAASGSLTTAVDHSFLFWVQIQTNAATTIQLRATESAGTITPRAGSYMKADKII